MLTIGKRKELRGLCWENKFPKEEKESSERLPFSGQKQDLRRWSIS